MTGVIVDSRGDDAEVRASIAASFCGAEHRPVLEGGSVWRRRLRRCGGDWLVAQFSLSLVWTRGSVPADWGVAG